MAGHRTPQSHPTRVPLALADFLFPTDVTVDDDAPDKTRLLWSLSHRAAAAVAIDGITVANEILKREALGSTGMGRGIAIPHARIHGLKKPLGILARLKTGIDFEAIDGEPVDIVFLLLLPGTSDREQSNALASVSRKLRDPRVVGDIRRANDAAGLYRAMVTESS